ncbi:MAG: PAS domain S-box protein, partial [Bacteroidales bacterium]|nr:PAS domain S-box protein [Bacteroidales bacterium]
MKLNAKILFFILLTSVLIFGTAVGIISISLKGKSYSNSTRLADTYVNDYANIIKTHLDSYMESTKVLQQIFNNFEDIPMQERRATFSTMMKRVLKENNKYISVWTIWEPNTIDTLDSQYINALESTFIGNYSPTFYKDKGQIKTQTSTEQELFQGDYYTIPKSTGKETIMEPYRYSYTGKKNDEVLETNTIIPIMKNDNFIGVVGIDVPLDNFQQLVDSIKPIEGSYAFLISNNGAFITHPYKNLVGKTFKDFAPFTQKRFHVLEKIKKGEKFSLITVDKEILLSYITFHPIKIGNTITPWSFAIVVPKEVLMVKAQNIFFNSILIGIVGLLILSLIILLVSKRIVTNPILKITNSLREIAKGNIHKSQKVNIKTNDEIGDISKSINKLVDGLDGAIDFANEIGQGNLDAEFKLLSEKDALGHSLIEMRESLVNASKEEEIQKLEEEKRNWHTRGLAKFGEILRDNNDNMKKFSYNIIKNLVKYVEVAQGAFFIINDEDEKNIYYDLFATIAFGRKKNIKKQVLLGEELIGRAAQEQKILYITNIPENFISITTGISTDKSPRNVLIIPLNLNDYIYGVIELVSFNEFEPYQIAFIEKVAESIASTIASIKVNLKTNKLLEQAQYQKDELSQHEEEMRQNLEELQATQEEAEKKDVELKSVIKSMQNIIPIIVLDMEGMIVSVNNKMAETYGYPADFMKGKLFDYFIVKDEKSRDDYEELLKELQDGNVQVRERRLVVNKVEKWVKEIYKPIIDDDTSYKNILIAVDISESKLLDKQIAEVS